MFVICKILAGMLFHRNGELMKKSNNKVDIKVSSADGFDGCLLTIKSTVKKELLFGDSKLK